jgi:gamma-glutamylcyclotransferase (GGCT)/AIG2-like uncharacterized protein YtfP
MTLHFAYGANMSRTVMRRYAPEARALGIAALAGHRFFITADGYASVETWRGSTVHGVLWQITPRDRVALDTWENVESGLYRAAMLAVTCDGRRRPALVYLARPSRDGRPKPGYIELVAAAAREWALPETYIHALQTWSPRPGADTRKIGEFR